MRKRVRPVALLILVSNVLFCSADELTRTFVLDPAALGIRQDALVDAESAVRNFLAGAGVDVESASAPRFFYNARTGVLHVTGAEAELSAIDQAARKLGPAPVRVLIKVAIAEFPAADQPEIAKLMGESFPDVSTWPPQTLNELVKAPRRELFSGILTEEQTRNVLVALERREGTDLLTAPPATTLSGRQVRIEFEADEPVTIPPFYAPGKKAKAVLDSLTE